MSENSFSTEVARISLFMLNNNPGFKGISILLLQSYTNRTNVLIIKLVLGVKQRLGNILFRGLSPTIIASL